MPGCFRGSGRSSTVSASSRLAASFQGRCLRRGAGIWFLVLHASRWVTFGRSLPWQWESRSESGSSWLRSFCCFPTERPAMRSKSSNEGRFAYEGLDRVIHERARLSILTSLLTNPKGVTFNDLKRLCSLTDGNLSRHLSVLE